MPRWVRASARAVSATGVSAMTRASASIFVSSPGQRRHDGRHAVLPAEDDRGPAIDRPPATAKRLRSGPSAALWKSPPPTTGAEVMIVTSCPLSARCSGGPETAPVVEIVEDEDAATRDGRAVEHVVDREHVGLVHAGESIDQRQRPLEPGPGRSRPGRHDRPRRRTRSRPNRRWPPRRAGPRRRASRAADRTTRAGP